MDDVRQRLLERFKELILEDDLFMSYIDSVVRPQVDHALITLSPDDPVSQAILDEIYCQYQVREINRFLTQLVLV